VRHEREERAVRLRRSDPGRPGYRRVRRGSGFGYRDSAGRALPAAEVDRIRALAIPPAWRDVWICPDPRGHLQAVGVDAAGRRQYRYHDVWRAQRDAAKFDHVLEVAERLPRLRRRVERDLDRRGFDRDRVLAAACRLLELGCFRVGGQEYAVGEDATFGLATLRGEHVHARGGALEFRYPAKGGIQRAVTVEDEELRRVVGGLRRRSGADGQLLGYRNGAGWHEVRAEEINDYLRETLGCDVTAKDFRTWHATVLAAAGLAAADTGSRTARDRAVRRVVREVADFLGNTPAVARASYVDPRVVDLYHDGVTVSGTLRDTSGGLVLGDPASHRRLERAVLRLLRDSP
jgi:DNA topoisomerase-1